MSFVQCTIYLCLLLIHPTFLHNNKLVQSTSIVYSVTRYPNGNWTSSQPSMEIFRNSTQYHWAIQSHHPIDYEQHFFVLHYWGEMRQSSIPFKLEVTKVERTSNLVSLYYEYVQYDPNTPPVSGGLNVQVSPFDIIQVEKGDSFTWDEEIEFIVYYNEEEVARTVVDFSIVQTHYLPLIQVAGPQINVR